MSSSAQWESSFHLLLLAPSLGYYRGKEQMCKIFATRSQKNGFITGNFSKGCLSTQTLPVTFNPSQASLIGMKIP